LLQPNPLVDPVGTWFDDADDLTLRLVFPQAMNQLVKPDNIQLTKTGYAGPPYPFTWSWDDAVTFRLFYTGGITTGPPFTVSYNDAIGSGAFLAADGREYGSFGPIALTPYT